MIKALGILAATSFLMVLGTTDQARAAIVHWDLSGVTGASGAETVTGFFDYDTATDKLAGFNIQASGPISVPSFPDGVVGNGVVFFHGFVSGVPSELALETPAAVPPFPCSTCDKVFAGTTPITLVPGYLQSPPDSFNGSVINVSNNLAGTIILSGTLVPAAAPEATLTTLHTFNGIDGERPSTGLIGDASGNLFGITSTGGASDLGTVFMLDRAGTYKVLYSFPGGVAGATPSSFGELLADATDDLFGATARGGLSGLGTVFKVTLSGSETVLYSFAGSSDGSSPLGHLVADEAGNLFGTTAIGGGNGCSGQGCGTIFKLSSTREETVLYRFAGGVDGSFPSPLIADEQGNLYGMTGFGGGLGSCSGGGCGTVFKLDTAGTKTVLYAFAGGSDGGAPRGGSLLLDSSGNLFGVTEFGGSGFDGTVFKLSPNGDGTYSKKTLHRFGGGSDGIDPITTLISDAAGNLYGTTTSGGAGCTSPPTCGTVFKLSPTGDETILWNFANGNAGGSPIGSLFGDVASGNLYGVTANGGGTGCGSTSGCGTIFKLTIPPVFAGQPGQSDCQGQSISFLSNKYRGLAVAAARLQYSSVTALRSAITAFCGG